MNNFYNLGARFTVFNLIRAHLISRQPSDVISLSVWIHGVNENSVDLQYS